MRLSRAKKAFLSEGDQKTLQHERRSCLLTEGALHRHNILTGATELRQFACLRCNHPWWKHVSRTKPVSTCNSCHVRYDALDRDKEFGIGRYICESCEHTFYAWCEATRMQECYGCNSLTGPPFISPRFKPLRNFAVVMPGPRPPPRIILYASTPHLSTGSTISSSAITEDLGSDIGVSLERLYVCDELSYSESSPNTPPDIHFEQGNNDKIGSLAREVSNLELLERPARSDIAGSEYLSGEVSELEISATGSAAQSAGTLRSSDVFDTESESGEISRERTEASDSDSDETSEVDMSAPEPGQDGWPSVGDSG